GGIVRKNPFMMQLYADILGKTIFTASTDQGSAFGAAVYAAVAAGTGAGGYASVSQAAQKMGKVGGIQYKPVRENAQVYQGLYKEYKRLHDYFGTGDNEVMHRLKSGIF
ncbi:MAG: FGGY-family carbohydrate kinase, partial [Ruminococcus flavefaciens]|nr:FGGY-family carbohydrate kinase [Ruminococcus flavefaciens]